MNEPTHRDDFGEYCNALGLNKFAVEIGTDLGLFARSFLSSWNGLMCFCVDPWETGLADYHDKAWDRLPDLICATVLLSKYMSRGRCRLIRAVNSVEVRDVLTRAVSGAMFDFVYIDANHTYKYVKEDIEIWWPVISPGGILAGHDYAPAIGVSKAVDEFCEQHGMEPTILDCTSWFVRKPGEETDE